MTTKAKTQPTKQQKEFLELADSLVNVDWHSGAWMMEGDFSSHQYRVRRMLVSLAMMLDDSTEWSREEILKRLTDTADSIRSMRKSAPRRRRF